MLRQPLFCHGETASRVRNDKPVTPRAPALALAATVFIERARVTSIGPDVKHHAYRVIAYGAQTPIASTPRDVGPRT